MIIDVDVQKVLRLQFGQESFHLAEILSLCRFLTFFLAATSPLNRINRPPLINWSKKAHVILDSSTVNLQAGKIIIMVICYS